MLNRQTKHVQFLVFDRKDADLEHPRGKLRDVNSYFLLAYFFEVSQPFLFQVTVDYSYSYFNSIPIYLRGGQFSMVIVIYRRQHFTSNGAKVLKINMLKPKSFYLDKALA